MNMVKLINDIKKLLETFTEYTKDPTVFLRYSKHFHK